MSLDVDFDASVAHITDIADHPMQGRQVMEKRPKANSLHDPFEVKLGADLFQYSLQPLANQNNQGRC